MPYAKRIKEVFKAILPNRVIGLCRRRMLADFLARLDDSARIEFRDEIAYMRACGRITQIPYPFADEHMEREVAVFTDRDGLPYVLDTADRRLYFPRSYSRSEIVELYRTLLIEQDRRSPHCYADGTHGPEGGTLLDVGAAEGMFSLRWIDRVERVVLVECDGRWVEPLERTFSPYGDKVRLVRGAVGGSSDAVADGIRECLQGSSRLFVKMDIEGAEMAALRTLSGVITRPGTRLSVCAYHDSDDASEIIGFLSGLGFSTRFTPGVMLIPIGFNGREFRKGVVYAEYTGSPSGERGR